MFEPLGRSCSSIAVIIAQQIEIIKSEMRWLKIVSLLDDEDAMIRNVREFDENGLSVWCRMIYEKPAKKVDSMGVYKRKRDFPSVLFNCGMSCIIFDQRFIERVAWSSIAHPSHFYFACFFVSTQKGSTSTFFHAASELPTREKWWWVSYTFYINISFGKRRRTLNMNKF